MPDPTRSSLPPLRPLRPTICGGLIPTEMKMFIVITPAISGYRWYENGNPKRIADRAAARAAAS